MEDFQDSDVKAYSYDKEQKYCHLSILEALEGEKIVNFVVFGVYV